MTHLLCIVLKVRTGAAKASLAMETLFQGESQRGWQSSGSTLSHHPLGTMRMPRVKRFGWLTFRTEPLLTLGNTRVRSGGGGGGGGGAHLLPPSLPPPPSRTMEVVVNQSATHQCSLGGCSPKYMLTCAVLMTSIHCGRCGTDFTVCVAEDGTVYSWGCNEYGCLGTSRTLDVTCRSARDRCVSYPLL